MSRSLAGRVVVVTGGTGILGTAFCEGLAGAGASVVVVGRRADVAESLARRLEAEFGAPCLAAPADVLEVEELKRARDLVLEKFGRIDVLVNGAGGNRAGATVNPEGSFFKVPPDEIAGVFNLNIQGVILATQIFGEAMAEGGRPGAIINVSSISAHLPLTRVVGYSAAKAGVENLTKWLAVELASKHGAQIRVNAIAPGFFLAEQNRTLLTKPDGSLTTRGTAIIDHTPLRRFGDPRELAPALVFLASDESKFMTGSILTVDGGFSAYSGI